MNETLIYLCKVSDVPAGGVIQVAPPGFDDGIAVYNLEGEFFATDDMCTHALVSLSQGDVEEGKIFCPLHGGAFDIRTGSAVAFPCTRPLKTYSVQVQGDGIYAQLG